MKDYNEIYQMGREKIDAIYPEAESLNKQQASHVFYEGFAQGYEEGFLSAKEIVPIVDIIATVNRLREMAKKVNLHLTADISLTYGGRATVTIYDLTEDGKLNDRVFEGNPSYVDGNLPKMGKMLADAETFILKYAEESEEKLAGRIEDLTAKLKDAKKKLATAKKVTKK